MISKEKLLTLIDTHFHGDLEEDSYDTKQVYAQKLLTHNRLDLAFKLLYLEMKDENVEFATDIYVEHIRAFSLGKFTEPGNETKGSIELFIEAFNKTFEDIKLNGFNNSKSLVPLSINGTIANGAHRVASAIFLNKDVECIELDSYEHIYDYKFFYSRNISTEILDIVATKFVEYTDNTYIAFIWPRANSTDEQIEEVIPNIVYIKEFTLNSNGAHNLLSQIYYGEEWLGNVENNFAGAKGKLVECFTSFSPVKVVAFQAKSLDEVLKIKENIRELFNVGKHSVHITDTKEEAIRTAEVIFNDNGIHFLNYAKPNRYISTHSKIDAFKSFMNKNNIRSRDILLDSSIVLSVYGLREAKDTDFLCLNNINIDTKLDEINTHDEELKYYAKSKQELILNPKNYFYFNDLKFLSFPKLYNMKENRAEIKDKNDLQLMEALVENNYLKGIISKIRQNIFYGKILLKQRAVIFLQKLGIFEIARKIYRKIKEYND